MCKKLIYPLFAGLILYGYYTILNIKKINTSWDMNRDTLLNELIKTIHGIMSFNVEDEKIARSIKVDKNRVNLTIDDKSYNSIPDNDDKIWLEMDLFNPEDRLIVHLCCTQVLWSMIYNKLFEKLDMSPSNIVFKNINKRYLNINKNKLTSILYLQPCKFKTNTNLGSELKITCNLYWEKCIIQKLEINVTNQK